MNSPTEIRDYLLSACGGVGDPDVYRALAEAAILHAKKNKGYRSSDNPMANFDESALVTKGLLSPSQYAYILMSKQDDAIPRLLWAEDAEYVERGGLDMLHERLLDGIVYRAILFALSLRTGRQ